MSEHNHMTRDLRPDSCPACRPLTLTDFLLARIGEDRVALPMLIGDQIEIIGGRRVSYWDRVLAECEAKRRIVTTLGPCVALGEPTPNIARGYKTLLTYLALPYADHPDYREEWLP